MKTASLWRAALVGAVLLALSTPARADFSFGYEARYAGMGGAGLAVIDNPTQAALVNPAALALRGKGFGVQWPNLGFNVEGIDIFDAASKFADFSLTAAEAIDMYSDFQNLKDGVDFSLNSGMGLALSSFDLRLRTQSAYRVKGVPESGSADVFGATQISPSVGFGFRLPTGLVGGEGLGDVRLGIRLKQSRTYYNHWVVKPAADGSGAEVSPTTGDDAASVSGTTLAADFGVLWQPAQIPYTTVALTVDNLIEPRFRIPGGASVQSDPNDPALDVAGEKLLPRTINLGAAFQLPAGLTLAADLLDLTGAVTADGKAQFRAGAEIRPHVPFLSQFALRAGYNQKTGWTGGFSLGNFSLAYAGDIPVIAGQSFNF